MSKHAMTMRGRFYVAARLNPAAIAAIAYGTYIILGSVLLWLPVSRDMMRVDAIPFVDALFISASAVSTTGLATLDPASSFSFFGELVILALLQIGGIGYMTVMSFAYLTLQNRMGATQRRLNRAGFGLNDEFDIALFVRKVVTYTLAIELVGAIILSLLFASAGTPNPVWNGIFHSVSAFCTAGFSLFATSLEAYKGNGAILMCIAVLSYLGAIGFIVLAELGDKLGTRKPISITSKLILEVTLGLAVFATAFLYFFEPSIAAMPGLMRLQNAFFQAMTASTTVGFNSVPIGAMAPGAIVVLYLLMFVGASPSGTGGGLKTTTVATLAATMVSVFRGRQTVHSNGIVIPAQRVQQAAGTLIASLLIVFVAVVLLDLTGNYAFDRALFEVISALATVGLSMGLTGELNAAGKLIIVAVMYIGRVGILAFFIAFASAGGTEEEVPLNEEDVIL